MPHIPVLSVVFLCKNGLEYFNESLASLSAQSFQNWELIIIDYSMPGMSLDEKSPAAVLKDSRVKVISALKDGTDNAKCTDALHPATRYVCCMDGKGSLERTFLEKCIWFLETNPEFAFCNSYIVTGSAPHTYKVSLDLEAGLEYIKSSLELQPITVMRREAFDKCNESLQSAASGLEYAHLLLSMAQSGSWGYTIREFLQRRQEGATDGEVAGKALASELDKLILETYEDVASRFPAPRRRHAMPFEDLSDECMVENPLSRNAFGRRILFLIPWMVTGGADRVNLDLIEGLVEKGHQLSVCATLSGAHPWESLFSELTPDVFILPNFLHVSDYARFLCYVIHSRTIDTVVVAGSTLGYQLLPYLRTRCPQTAFVDLCHVEEMHWLNGGHPRFGAGYQETLELNIVTTAHLAQWMTGRGADGNRIRIMYTGVRLPEGADTDGRRQRLRNELGVEGDTPLIVFAGRLCRQKRPDVLAEILKALRDKEYGFHALIIGDGELRSHLESLLARYSVTSRATFLGTVAHPRWIELLSACDILLMPSEYEGISLSLLEAMAAGVIPVIADVGGQDEVVDAETGYLVPHGKTEVQEYVRALGELMDKRDMRHAKASSCRQRIASRFSRRRTIEQLEGILAEAHCLREAEPRLRIGHGLTKELAALAIEYKRLNDTLALLWNNRGGSENIDNIPYVAPIISAVSRMIIRFCRTRFGSFILNHSLTRKIGRKILIRSSSC